MFESERENVVKECKRILKILSNIYCSIDIALATLKFFDAALIFSTIIYICPGLQNVTYIYK
jgi:hypothetical protein